jgi:phospholipid/cholesterol/gamma-HCH transport system permease protein
VTEQTLTGRVAIVTGGAVGIGRAVAKTMAISLVAVVVLNAVETQIFWGQNPNLPIPT